MAKGMAQNEGGSCLQALALRKQGDAEPVPHCAT